MKKYKWEDAKPAIEGDGPLVYISIEARQDLANDAELEDHKLEPWLDEQVANQIDFEENKQW